MFKKIFGKSWQSSAAGYAIAVAMVVGSAYQRKVEDPKAPPVTVETLIAPAIAAVVGRFYKESAEKQAIEDARAKRDANITVDLVEKKVVEPIVEAVEKSAPVAVEKKPE